MTWQIQVLAHHKLRRILIGGDGAERLAGVLTQCAALAYLNLSSKAEIRKDIHISEIQ